MQLRFCLDPDTSLPHFQRHGVTEAQVVEVLAAPLEDGAGAEGARVAVGRTEAGRFLKIIYLPDPDQGGVRHYRLRPRAEGTQGASA